MSLGLFYLAKNMGHFGININGSLDTTQEVQSSEQLKSVHLDLQKEYDLPLLRSIGQLGLTYIAAEGPDGLYLIDQHGPFLIPFLSRIYLVQHKVSFQIEYYHLTGSQLLPIG